MSSPSVPGDPPEGACGGGDGTAADHTAAPAGAHADHRATAAQPDAPTPVSGSAAPPLGARLAAFASIVVAGVCGGLIGYAVTDRSCQGGCQTAAGGVALFAALGAAIGVAIVAVLVLRAMGEWQATPEQVRRAAREAAHRKRTGPKPRPRPGAKPS